MRIDRWMGVTLLGSLLALTACGGVYEEGQLMGDEEGQLDSSASELAVTFTAGSDGLNFGNSFKSVVVADITTGGLCGGMVYTALDYFYSPKNVPPQNYRPAPGTALRDYVYNRQVDSITRNADKWAELGFNPLGVRNEELWRWGLEKDGRVAELRKAIDAGKPVPLGLESCSGCGVGRHQVLALSYELGAYDAGLKGYPNLKIKIYDPSFPNQTRTLRTSTQAKRWYDEADTNRAWQAYFVDAKYSTAVPPTVSAPVEGLLLTMSTGGDDLRGGSDNLNVKVTLKSGASLTFNNVNLGRRWIDSSTEEIAVPVANPATVASVTLTTTFGGGIGGDNWNLDKLVVKNIENSVSTTQRYSKAAAPLMRFTGDAKTLKVTLN